MNNRIQQLVVASTDNILGVNELDHKKFARLIIQECIDICEQGTATQTTSGGAADLIRLHFGVE